MWMQNSSSEPSVGSLFYVAIPVVSAIVSGLTFWTFRRGSLKIIFAGSLGVPALVSLFFAAGNGNLVSVFGYLVLYAVFLAWIPAAVFVVSALVSYFLGPLLLEPKSPERPSQNPGQDPSRRNAVGSTDGADGDK